MKPIVFFSYSRQDSEFVLKLGKDMRASGINIWLDQLDIKPGELWDVAIQKALAGCSRILVVLSPVSVESTNVMDEVSYALEERKVVIPVLLRDCEIPFRLRRLQHTDFRADYQTAFDKLLQYLNVVPSVAATHQPETGSKAMATRGLPSRRAWVIAAAAVVVILGVWITLKMMPPSSNIVQMPADIADATSAPSAKPDVSAKTDAPAVRDASALVAVPDVVSMTLDEASSTLTEARLSLGRTSFLTLGRYKPGIVYGQVTRAGTQVRPETAIDVYVERERRRGIHSSGQMYLSHTEVIDLDQDDSSSREGVDIRFDGANPTERYLEPINGAALAAGSTARMTRDGCATAPFSNSHVRLAVGEQLCARTTSGRYSLLKIDDLGRELKLSFNTLDASPSTPINAAEARVRLGKGESYHFRSGVRGRFTGGDLYLTIADNGAAEFFANNQGQRGLVDLGDVGSVHLSEVRLPSGRFNKFGVPVVTGHTYVSLAREGDGSHFIVLRVDQVTSEFVALTYVYRAGVLSPAGS